MWAYSFMQHALLSGLIIATICGIISVFVVLRRVAFATHALGHMSLTGAAGSALLGSSMITGQLTLNLICAVIMGLMGNKIKKNDLAVGVVLTFVLGLGAYFLFLFQNNYAGGVMSILFGNILAVSLAQIYLLLALSMIILIILLIIARPLLFASIDPIVASSKNVHLRFLSVVFFMLLALTVSMACQIVGALLVFVMLIIPGAIGIQWGNTIFKITAISVIVANFSVVLALIIAYYFNLPVSFCITSILSFAYIIRPLSSKLQKFFISIS